MELQEMDLLMIPRFRLVNEVYDLVNYFVLYFGTFMCIYVIIIIFIFIIKAFSDAWNATCKSSVSFPTMYVPQGMTFLLQPLTFNGSCNSRNITVQVQIQLFSFLYVCLDQLFRYLVKLFVYVQYCQLIQCIRLFQFFIAYLLILKLIFFSIRVVFCNLTIGRGI